MSLRALLIERNIKQIDIARKYFIDPSEVNKVVLGKRSTPRIREAIAKELHLNPQDIWKDV
jgi:DNA-binding Xre family transcriptional regulator